MTEYAKVWPSLKSSLKNIDIDENQPDDTTSDDPDADYQVDSEEEGSDEETRTCLYSCKEIVGNCRPCTVAALLAAWELVFPKTAITFIICAFLLEAVTALFMHPRGCACVACKFTRVPGVQRRSRVW
jgi:hypothetical protein